MRAAIVCVCTSAFLGSTYSLVLERVRLHHGGTLPFHSPSSVFYTELFKLFFMLIAIACDKKRLSERPELKTILSFSIPAVFYTIQNNANMWVMERIDAVTFQMINSLKIVFTGVVMRVCMGRRLTLSQWMILGVMTLGVASTRACDGAEVETKRHADGILMAVLTQVVGALGVVANEIGLKSVSSLSFYHKNALIYAFGSLCALPFWKPSTLTSFAPEDWGVAVYLSFVGISVAFVLRYTDSLVKNMVSIATVCMTSILWFGMRARLPPRALVYGVCICTLSFGLYYAEADRVRHVLPVKD